MQTPDFNLKSLRTLGIFLTCGVLVVGCAGNTIKPMAQDTGSISSSQASSTVASSDATPSAQMTSDSTTNVANDTSTPASDTTSASADEDKTMDTKQTATSTQDSTQTQTTASIQEPAQTNFYFNLNKATLDDQDKAVLIEHAQFLKANPSLILEINGHTDHTGTLAYNKYLSKQRAEAVAKVLIDNGVKSSQLVINALADTKPMQGASSSDQNRRVDLQYDDMSMVSTK